MVSLSREEASSTPSTLLRSWRLSRSFILVSSVSAIRSPEFCRMHSCWVLRISWAKAGLLISETASKIRRCLGFPTVSGVMVPERYPSRFAVSKICCAVASLTWPGRENALETVEGDTPAARATSTIPGYVLCLDISCATGVWEFSLQYMLYVPLVTDCNIYMGCA